MEKNNNSILSKFKMFIEKFLRMLIKYKKTTVSIVFLLIFAYISYLYYKYFNILKDPIKIKKLILSYGNYSIFVFLLFQIIQVVVFFIPGEIIQIAGGYIYGTFIGGIISTIGICMGSAIVYYIAGYLGKDLIKNMFSNDKFKLLHKILKVSGNIKVIFFLYLVPGIPKDALAYICGVSNNISFKDFIVFSTLGRIPGIFISTYFGNKISKGEVTKIIFISIVMIVLFIIGSIKGKNILKKISEKNKLRNK